MTNIHFRYMMIHTWWARRQVEISFLTKNARFWKLTSNFPQVKKRVRTPITIFRLIKLGNYCISKYPKLYFGKSFLMPITISTGSWNLEMADCSCVARSSYSWLLHLMILKWLASLKLPKIGKFWIMNSWVCSKRNQEKSFWKIVLNQIKISWSTLIWMQSRNAQSWNQVSSTWPIW